MFFFNLLIVYLTNIAWIDWSQTCTTVDLKNASRTCWDNGIYTKNKHRPVKTKIIEIFQIEKSNSFLTVFSISLKTLGCIKVREILFNTYIAALLTNLTLRRSSAAPNSLVTADQRSQYLCWTWLSVYFFTKLRLKVARFPILCLGGCNQRFDMKIY